MNKGESVRRENLRKQGGQVRYWVIYRQLGGTLKRHGPTRKCHVATFSRNKATWPPDHSNQATWQRLRQLIPTNL